jgi:cobalamin biosynthesis protein CbiG
MPEETGKDAGARPLDLQLWVPAEGELRGIAAELAEKVAEHLGAPDARSLGQKVAGLASQLAGTDQDIVFDFRERGGELVVEGRCAGQASEVRQPLPV